MGPTSSALAAALLVLGLLVPLLLAALWWRTHRGQRAGRKVGTTLLVVVAVLASQVAVASSAAILVNRSLGLYPTWADVGALTQGQEDLEAAIPNNAPVKLSPQQAYQIEKVGWAYFRVQPRKGEGQYRIYMVPGPSNHTKQPVIVWIPPGYEKQKKLTNLPVVYLYNAAYGSVDWFMGAVRPAESAGPMVRSKKIKPFVIVAPEININAPGDTECTNYPHGPQAYSWLDKDVPAWAHAQLGVATGAANASAIGWSVGGYCAAKLHAGDPLAFGAAVSVQGFFQVEADRTTGALTGDLRADAALRQRTDVGWLLRNVPSPNPVHLLVVTSKSDPQSYTASMKFLQGYGSTPGISSAIYERAGHSVTSWRGLQPDLWRFLVARTPWPQRLASP